VVDIERAQSVLGELRRLSEDASDTLECRIEAALGKMASVELFVLPVDEPVTVDQFLAAVEARSTQAAAMLTRSVYLGNLYSTCIINLRLILFI